MTKTFDFYLEAWNYCRQNNIDFSRVYRLSWKHWAIDFNVLRKSK